MGAAYGEKELAYAAPFANALIESVTFRTWVLSRTKFAASAHDCRLLQEDMKAARSKTAATWWRSHFNGTCRCDGCRGGQETDLLAIFERSDGYRFALHVEVKQPSDRFPAKKDQAANYALRAACWTSSTPKAVLPHSDADTMLLCSAAKLDEYYHHLGKFGSVLTFEELATAFPDAGIPPRAPAELKEST